MNKALILFIKFPRPNEVKTRLAAQIGNDLAISFYRFCVDRITKEMKKVSADCFVFVSKEDDIPAARDWLGRDMLYRSQRGTSLGEKIQNAFKEIQKDYSKVILLGSDIPDLSSQILNKGFENLEENDVTIGPCPDGGYYLVGLKKPSPQIFDDINWSTDQVFEQTLHKMRTLGLTYSQLPLLSDVDTRDDLINWSERNQNLNSFLNIRGKVVR